MGIFDYFRKKKVDSIITKVNKRKISVGDIVCLYLVL